MRGKKPFPIAALKANGTYKKSRHAAAHLTPDALETIPEPPETLPEQCRGDWNRVCRLLKTHNVLTALDLDGIERYCFLLHVYRSTQAAVLTAGPVVTSETKYGRVVKSNPAVGVVLDLARELRALGERLGFDPVSRQRIKLTPDNERPDPLAELARQMGAGLMEGAAPEG